MTVQDTYRIAGKEYRLVGCVGEGTHAVVYNVQSLVYPGEELIVKVAKESQGVCAQRLQNEIRFLKEFHHPHIPPLLAFGGLEGGETPWLAMPRLGPLSVEAPRAGQIIRFHLGDVTPTGYPSQARQIPWKYRLLSALEILEDIGSVIEYLSGTGIIHADISPGNILEKKISLLHKERYLTDWGATALMHDLPQETFGSLHFTAPERLRGEVGDKTDAFSLGVIAFYVLTGTVPYGGQTAQAYSISCIERDGIAPGQFESQVPADFDHLIRDLIRKDPRQRPAIATVLQRVCKIRRRWFPFS